MKCFMEGELRKARSKSVGYYPRNHLFSREIRTIMKNPNHNYDLNKNIERSIRNVVSLKEEFEGNIIYTIIFRILCYFPDVLIKFIYIKKNDINFKYLRLFMSYVLT